MNRSSFSLKPQRGVALLEALISVLIFSIGCLALIGLQAMALKSNADAKYRADAAYLANQLISQMWVETPADLGTYAHRDGGTPSDGACSLTGTATSNARATAWITEVKNQLGGATADGYQQIKVMAQKNAAGNVISYQVYVTICWHQPSDPSDKYHNYTASAQIGINS